MKQVQVIEAEIVKNLVVIIAQVMVRALSPVASVKVVAAIRRLKLKTALAVTRVNHRIHNVNRRAKQSQLQGQVNHPMALVAVNEVAVKALLAIALDLIDAVIDKFFYSAY